jgi:hypothetical protein
MVHHLHLSCLAHLLLTVAELQRGGPKAWTKRAAQQLPSVRIMQHHLRHQIQRDILRRLRVHCSDTSILERLEKALEAA